MTTIKNRNSLSTTFSSILLLITRPLIPPKIPPTTMRTNSQMENSGTVPVTREFKSPVIWENRMMYREFWAAAFVSME